MKLFLNILNLDRSNYVTAIQIQLLSVSLKFYFCFLIIFSAFTDTKIPFDDSRKANMASVLFPVIKPELIDEFVMIWDIWFVLEDTVQDEKFPGKLKSKIYIIFIVIH